MPKSPKTPKQPRNPSVQVHERELEDQVGRSPDAEPELVPPGTPVRRSDDADTSRGERTTDGDDPDDDDKDIDEGLVADRANARTSDRRDARDGVDNSDSLTADPDAAGGKSPNHPR
jgi:hypothetical protein